MATYLERFNAICNALVDGTATVAQRTAVGDAFVAQLEDSEITSMFPLAFPPVTRATLTNEQRAAIVVTAWKEFTQGTWRRWRLEVKQAEGRAAALSEQAPI